MPKWLKLPGDLGRMLHLGDDKSADRAERLIHARHEFTLAYMKEHGWGEDIGALSFKQILEIREQPGWDDPLKETN